MRLTLDQQRADFAWKKTGEAKSFIKEYTTVAKSTASLIMNSGLMQTLAFLKSKDSSDEYKAVLAHLLEWLDIRFLTKKENTPPSAINNPAASGRGITTNCSKSKILFNNVIQNLFKANSTSYMQLTSETMALLKWIRQFADARKAMEMEKTQ